MRAGVSVSIAMMALSACATGGLPQDPTQDPRDVPAPPVLASDFQTTIDNPWWPLVVGTTHRYVERNGKERSEAIVTVTAERKLILGVSCVVVHDQLLRDGKVLEDTFDWYAQDRRGNVWYFGEDTREYDDKGRSDTAGSWEAGVGGAQPGIVMQANPAPGPPYRQEYLRGEAEDMGQVIATNDVIDVPFGHFTGGLRTREWSELEAGSERKWYARGIGFVRSESDSGEIVELVAIERLP